MARKLRTKCIDDIMPEMAELRLRLVERAMANPFTFRPADFATTNATMETAKAAMLDVSIKCWLYWGYVG